MGLGERLRHAGLGALAAAALTSTALALPAQVRGELRGPEAGVDYAEKADSEEAARVLAGRQRDAMHPGDPLELVGGFAEGNDLRRGLRSLGRGEFEVAAVDENEAYGRQIALLRGGAPMTRGQELLEAGDEERQAAPLERGAESQGDEPYDTTWIGMVLAAAASVGLYLTRGRGPALS